MPSPAEHEAALQTFLRKFSTEEDCIDFLFPLRWPQGFVCPFCHTRHPHFAPQRYLICPHCGNRSSLTTGTIMHGARKPLQDWLLAMWWFSGSRFGTSAKELQRLLALSCYQTAWSWLQKLRVAMGAADTSRCQGVVAIGCDTVAPAQGRKERALVLTAAEIVPSIGITGRIRMRHIQQLDRETLADFLRVTVHGSSSLLPATDALAQLLIDLPSYYVVPETSAQPARTEELNRSFETCLHTVHRGGVTVKHLQLYLDEFCFRNNAALLPDHEAVFRALLSGVFAESIAHYRKIASSGCSLEKRWRP